MRALTRRLAVPALLSLWLVVGGASPPLGESKLPSGLSFVARDAAGRWGLYLVRERGLITHIPTELEPRQACVAPAADAAVYAASDGTLRWLSLPNGPETVLTRPSKAAGYTQPCMSRDGRDVYAVELDEGRSIETELVWLRRDSPPQRFARQTGAQNEPFIHQSRWLVYAHVGCSDGCDRLLVEIWGRDLLAGTARQLTLLNAFSQAPVTDGKRVVFSSDASGGFQLWQVGFDGQGLQQLTQGPLQALQPTLCGGELFFVRSGPEKSVLARQASDGLVAELPLQGLTSIRSLRCLS